MIKAMGLKMILVQDSNSWMGFYIIKDGPCRLQVFQSRHDFPAAGHFGFNKIMDLISRDFWLQHK
jgi:hypothetical protein